MANEIKRLYFGSQSSPVASGNVEAGTYDLTFDGQTASGLNYNDSAGTIQAALEALSSIGSGNVAVSATANGHTVEFQGALANTNVGALTAGNITLKQKADTVSVTTTTNGAAGAYEAHTISMGGATTGTFDMTNGFATPTVSSLDSAGLQVAYDSMYGPGVTISDIGGGNFPATFPNQSEQSNPSVSSNSTDGSPSVTVDTEGVTPVYQVVSVTLPDSPTEGTLNVTLDGSTSSDFNYNDASPASITGWTGGGSAGSWTYTRDTAASNVSASGAEGSTPLRKNCGIEIVTTQEGSAGGYTLTASSVATGSPSVGSPVIGQSHSLATSGLAAGNPAVGSPTLGQIHNLTSAHIASEAPTVTSPTLSQINNLTATNVESGSPSVGSPSIGQTYALTGSNIATGSPVVGTPSLSQVHALFAASVACGSPTVSEPTLVPVVPLTADSAATQSPSVSQPAIGQKHALTASNITTGSPTVGTPSLSQIHTLTSSSVVCDSPSVGSPTIGQTCVLTADNVSTGSPSLTSPAIGQIHDLTGSSVATGSPALDSPAISSVLVADSIATGTPDVSSPTLLQKIVLAATSIETSAPSVTSPSITQVHALSATSLTTGSPTLTSPTLRRLAIAKTYTLHGPGQVTLKGSEPVTLNGAPTTHRLS